VCVHLADRFTPSIFFPISAAVRPFPQPGISAVVSEALAWASPWRVGREQHYSRSWRIRPFWRCGDPLRWAELNFWSERNRTLRALPFTAALAVTANSNNHCRLGGQ